MGIVVVVHLEVRAPMVVDRPLLSCPPLLTGITEATHQLLTIPAWETALSQAFETLATHTGCDRLRLWEITVSPESSSLQPCHIFPPDTAQLPVRLDCPSSCCLQDWWEHLQCGVPFQAGRGEVSPLEEEWLIEQGILAVLVLPIQIEQNLTHILSLEYTQRPYCWSEAEINLLKSFAVQLGGVIELRRRSAQLLWRSFAIARQQQQISQQQCRQISESRLRRQNQVLVELARRKNLHRGDFSAALQEITSVAAETLEVERTSVSIYNPERTRIYCLDLYERSQDCHSQGLELQASLYPDYFRALEQERTIAAHDALNDPRTHEFAESYLSPLGIASMLDAPIWLGGQMVGVVCHEHIGEKRQWTMEEQQFAASIADLVSLAMEARDRYQAQEELRASEERLKSFFNATFEAVFIHDQGRILDVNHAAETLFGYTTTELIGMLATDLAMPECRPLLVERIQQPSDSPFEATGLRKDGRTFIAEVSGKSIIYQGRPARVVGIRDITERKRAEAALEALNANLEQQVEERTAQLQQKMQELQDLNQLKDVFLHAVSHDLRTPVMGTLLVLNNLLNPPGQSAETPANPPATVSLSRGVIERMIASQKRQLTLIDTLLETHASDVQGMVLHQEPIQLGILAQGIIDDLEPLLSKNQAIVHNLIAPNLPTVEVDAIQLRRVYENLITNALKHNPPGLTLTLTATQDSNALICTVQDNGVGISPEQSKHLFDLYFRGSNSRHLKGIGLGLYLCRQVIQTHKGEIGVISSPGEGATFWFSLPLPPA